MVIAMTHYDLKDYYNRYYYSLNVSSNKITNGPFLN